MKVGILTHPLENNYGGLLQAFALQMVVKRMGHEVYTIDRHNKGTTSPFPKHLAGYLKRCFQRYIKKDPKVSTKWDPRISLETKKKLGQNMQSFIDRNIRVTDCVWSDNLRIIENKYRFDAYIVGSDQVWLPNYLLGSFLDFVDRDDVIKCTYAASCSAKSWTQEQVKECKELVKSFKGISVRETDLIDFCKEELGVDALHVLDPTLLLDKDDFLSAVDIDNNIIESPVIFTYILDNSNMKKEALALVSSRYSNPIAWVNAKRPYYKRNDVNIDDCIFPSVDQWINNLNNASFVITDSFHGTALSIVFNKQFIAIANKSRGISRFKSLDRKSVV